MEPPQQYSSAVREMREEDRPRERLERLGAEALKDAELIAVLIRTGTREEGAVALAERLLREFNGLNGLSRASVEEMRQVKGIGRVKAIEVKAALELGKRIVTYRAHGDRPRIRSAQDVYELLRTEFKAHETEHFISVLLNQKNDVLKYVRVSQGSITETLAAPGDVFRTAVREGATAIIVAHNHPSGDPEPSRQDVELTRRLAEAGELMGIRLLDHVVFGDNRYVSLKERQLM